MPTATCPYCRTAIADGETVTACTSCGLPYHLECWRENGGCATYGCAGHRGLAPRGGAVAHPLRVEVELAPEPAPSSLPRWRQPLTRFTRAGEPRPLLVVLCEALGVIGGLAGAVVGAVEGARAGALGVATGLVTGAVLGLIAGFLALPLGLIGLSLYLTERGMEAWGAGGAAVALGLGVALFALLMRVRVRSWPHVFS